MMSNRCEKCRAPIVREGDRVQFDSSRYHMDAVKRLSEISALNGEVEDLTKENERLREEIVNLTLAAEAEADRVNELSSDAIKRRRFSLDDPHKKREGKQP